MARALAAALTALALAGGAPAATIRGTPAGELLRGTERSDHIHAGAGDDRVRVQGGGRDDVTCGPGADIVVADLTDLVAGDCERVSRQISADRRERGPGQHRTEVEPGAASYRGTTVAVVQVGRIFAGGSLAIGWAATPDGGRTWRSGLLPGLTSASSPPGPFERVSDPVIAYDRTHDIWLAASFAIDPGTTAFVVNTSRDTRTWSPPVVAARAPADIGFGLDKEWLACDNGAASRYAGRCYLSYTDDYSHRLVTQTSADGGLTWSAPVPSPLRPAGLPDLGGGLQPVVLPDGTVVVTYGDDGDLTIYATRSIDGGASFGPPVAIAPINYRAPQGFRAPPLASTAVDAAGRIYVAFPSCPSITCARDTLYLSTSTDGSVWGTPMKVAQGSQVAGDDQVLPALGAGAPGRLVLTYYSLPAGCLGKDCSARMWLAGSRDGGKTWRVERLDAEQMPLGWLASTESGRMVGDYTATVFSATQALCFFVLARAPHGGALDEALFVTTATP